jgi:hypothetical protein
MNKVRTWQSDKQQADKYWPQIKVFLTILSPILIDYEAADLEEDATQAADYKIQSQSGTIAARVRWDGRDERDLTIRSWRKSGAETELSKIKAGYARWYFYGWAVTGVIKEWMIIDLDGLRASGLLDKYWRQYPNKDNSTAFIAIPRTTLKKHGLILGSHEGQLSLMAFLSSETPTHNGQRL